MGAAWIVVGLGYGDEGKGTIVDALVRKTGARTVVRFNGGGQAAHNVCTEDGRHHTFSQWGSGTLAGARTILTKDFILNPLAMKVEGDVLGSKGVMSPLGLVSVDARALVSTPFHAALNQIRELARGTDAHGTCGVGIGETVADSETTDRPIRAADLRYPEILRRKIRDLRARLRDRAQKLMPIPCTVAASAAMGMLMSDLFDDKCVLDMWAIGDQIHVLYPHGPGGMEFQLRDQEDLVLEGAQGALLDEWHGFHPHTTWSTTTAHNAREFLSEMGWHGEQTTIGVVRRYATRHGAGPFPTEIENANLAMELHNNGRGWQGRFRIGAFDAVATRYAIAANDGVDCVALTHYDVSAGQEVCVGYRTPQGGRIGNLVARFDRDLARQQKLGELIAASKPIVEKWDGTPFEVEKMLGVPVDIESHGPTAEDKRWARRFHRHQPMKHTQ